MEIKIKKQPSPPLVLTPSSALPLFIAPPSPSPSCVSLRQWERPGPLLFFVVGLCSKWPLASLLQPSRHVSDKQRRRRRHEPLTTQQPTLGRSTGSFSSFFIRGPVMQMGIPSYSFSQICSIALPYAFSESVLCDCTPQTFCVQHKSLPRIYTYRYTYTLWVACGCVILCIRVYAPWENGSSRW